MKYQTIRAITSLSLFLSIGTNGLSAQSTIDQPDPHDYQDETVVIAGTMLPHFFHPRQKGAYNILFEQIFDDINIDDSMMDYQLNFLPVRRAYRSFSTKASDCYFIANRKNYMADGKPKSDTDIIASDTIHISLKKIYTLRGQPTYEDMASLENLTFAADEGAGTRYVLPTLLPKNSKLVPTESVEQSIQLLKSGRVDAIVAYELDMLAFQQMMGQVAEVHASTNFNIQESESAIVCWDKPKTTAFLNIVNEQLARLKASGELIDPVKIAHEQGD